VKAGEGGFNQSHAATLPEEHSPARWAIARAANVVRLLPVAMQFLNGTFAMPLSSTHSTPAISAKALIRGAGG